MIVLDLSILNQKGTPMFNSDTFANRPNFGIVGRIFISTDTKEFYRDTGTSWELIGGPGSGTITGSGAATQVAFWNGASTISGSNNLWWDSTNNYLGINTNTPTTALDVHHSTNSGAIFNQTTATNNNTINFQTSGSGRWRIGNFYTAGADDFGVFDVVGALQQFTIVKTTGQTFVGAKTTASGRLVVNSATADNHLQIVGANAPSIRIDNAGSGGTQRFVIGNATATNNFIQGSTAGDFCITTASAAPLLFGMWQTTNASEVMRITTANNLVIGSSVDNGQKLQVNGSSLITGIALFSNNVGIGVSPVTIGNYKVLNIQGNSTSNGGLIQLQNSDNSVQAYWFSTGTNSTLKTLTNNELIFGTNNTDHLYLKTTGNLLVGTSVDGGQKLQVNGNSYINGTLGIGILSPTATLHVSDLSGGNLFKFVSGTTTLEYFVSGGNPTFGTASNNDLRIMTNSSAKMTIKTTGVINLSSIPASSAGLVSGDIYQTAGVLNIVP